VTDAPAPEQHPWYSDALILFMNGKWQQLGITDPAELKVLGRINRARRYGDVPVPTWEAKRIWDRHKARILADWERKLEESEADPDCYKCRTCPFCACPGMN
jgi:hypothetical protein